MLGLCCGGMSDGGGVDIAPMEVPSGELTQSENNARHRAEGEDALSKLAGKGIHSLTRSVTDDVTKPVSDENGSLPLRQAHSFSEKAIDSIVAGEEIRSGPSGEVDDLAQRSLAADDEEGGDGEIDEEFGRRIFSSPSGKKSVGKEADGDGVAQELQQDETSDLGSVVNPPLRSDPEEVSSRPITASSNSVSFAEDVDAVPNLETATREFAFDGGSAQQSKFDSDISVFYPHELNLGEVLSPFSLEERIRRAREDQDLALEWEVENAVDARLLATATEGVSPSPPSRSNDLSSSMPELEEIYPNKSGMTFARPAILPSEINERRRGRSSSGDLADEQGPTKRKTAGPGEAVLLGALASGVNRPTWFLLRAVLVGLVLSLFLLLYVAIQVTDLFILLNVIFFIVIAGLLIVLLSWYIAEVGFVSVESQMAELNLTDESNEGKAKAA